MPRVHHRKARKDYPDSGIQKGEMYYTWSRKTGPRSSVVGRSKTYPLPEQLTSSEYLQQWYPMVRAVEGFDGDQDALEEITEEFRALGEEQQEKLDNMPEGLQEGDAGQTLQERIDECEQVVTDLEGVEPVDEDAEDAEAEEERFHREVQECTPA